MDQASNLREFVRQSQNCGRVLAVTSGKGGVGKTSTSVNLAIALRALGKRVIVLDADLGLANVEVLLGLNSFYNLQHVIDGEKTIMQILVKGPGGIEIVPGTSGLAKLADLSSHARQNVLNGLRELQEKSDYVIIDTMAGIGQNAIRFAAAADEILVITTPEPSAIVDAYATIKTISQVRENPQFQLLVNMAGSEEQANAVRVKLSRVAQQYLNLSLKYTGWIPRDFAVSQGVMQTHPFILRFPNCQAARAMQVLAQTLCKTRGTDQAGPGFFRRFAQHIGLASNA